MKTARKFLSTAPTRTLLCLALFFALLTTLAHSQAAKPEITFEGDEATPENVTKAMTLLRSGDLRGIWLVIQGNAVRAIPLLKAQFPVAKEDREKQQIAAALVRLGEKDDLYWNYLANQASLALQGDVPKPFLYDEHGMEIRDRLSPAFTAWAEAHNTPVGEALEHAMFETPRIFIELGITHDARAIPLLRRALLSQDNSYKVIAAENLAELQDKDSIQLIIEVCKRSPASAASSIALSLVYFDDPQAQRAVDQYSKKENAKILRDQGAVGQRPLEFKPKNSAKDKKAGSSNEPQH